MKTKCPLCDFENEEGTKFCSNCNVPLIKQDYSEDNPYIKKKREENDKLNEPSIEITASKGINQSLSAMLPILGLTREQEDRIYFIQNNYLSDIRRMERELIALLLGEKWEWPEFDKWFKKFTELNYLPYMWAYYGLSQSIEEIPEGIQALNTFINLSLDARRLLVGNLAVNKENQVTRAVEDIGSEVDMMTNETLKLIEELKESNLAKYPLEISENLPILKVEDLKKICEKYNLPKTGKKLDIVERISQNIPENDLRILLPREAQRDAARIGFSLSPSVKNYIDWNIAKIKLLSHNLELSSYKFGSIEGYIQSGVVKKVQISGTDDCPICALHSGETVNIEDLLNMTVLDSLPPYHPGCRCTTVPFFD
jgi:hypothetical protein